MSTHRFTFTIRVTKVVENFDMRMNMHGVLHLCVSGQGSPKSRLLTGIRHRAFEPHLQSDLIRMDRK